MCVCIAVLLVNITNACSIDFGIHVELIVLLVVLSLVYSMLMNQGKEHWPPLANVEQVNVQLVSYWDTIYIHV